jgi:hypothetical protein
MDEPAEPAPRARALWTPPGPEGISGLKPVYIRYDKNKFIVDFEEIPVEDKTLQSSWGNQVYRIVLTARQTPLQDEFSIRVE